MNKQRKLTWIEKKQIERIAFDHPFFDMHGTVLSKKEAKAIIRSAEARKSGVEIVFEACDKAGVPRPDFVDNHSSVFDNLKEIVAIPAIRRIGIIVIALILLVVFFTATPTGRAIAESVIQYIVTLFEDGELVMNQPDNKSALVLVDDEDHLYGYEQQDGQSDYITVKTFDDFTKDTGKIPATLPLSCTELYYVYDPDISYLELYSTYDTTEGKIVAYQIWDMECITSSTLDGFSLYDLDDSVYYSIEEKTGYIYCKVFYEDSVFSITSKGNYTLDDLIRMLKER